MINVEEWAEIRRLHRAEGSWRRVATGRLRALCSSGGHLGGATVNGRAHILIPELWRYTVAVPVV